VSRDDLAREIVKHGCPTDSESYCFYCRAEDIVVNNQDGTFTFRLEHKDDCPWPAFERAYT
jgi:hypothetical protein